MSDLVRAELELAGAIQGAEHAEYFLLLYPFGTAATKAEREALGHIRTALIELKWAQRLIARIEQQQPAEPAPTSSST